MRLALGVLLLYASSARADGIAAGAAVGAGGQGDAIYSGIDLGVDVQWQTARVGLGGRLVWIDGELRDRDFQETRDAVRAVRLLELRVGPFALAGGGLAPALIAHVADGHRASLDDRPRTGVRTGIAGERVAIGAELDDVLDPSLVGGALYWQFTDHWRVHAATVNDPSAALSSIEFALGRIWEGERAIAEAGAGFVAEPSLGAQAIAFGDVVVERFGMRWFASAEARAGSGTVGAAFGPLHRLERARLGDARGAGGAIAIGAAAKPGWIRASLRARPDLGVIGAASIGAPMGKWLQASAWLASTSSATAGAAELRVAWARRTSTVIEIARMYDTDTMEPTPAWSATAWFGITTD